MLLSIASEALLLLLGPRPDRVYQEALLDRVCRELDRLKSARELGQKVGQKLYRELSLSQRAFKAFQCRTQNFNKERDVLNVFTI